MKLFPIDSLKIDRSFASNIFADSKDAALVQMPLPLLFNQILNGSNVHIFRND
nr:hypothetical protein [Paenibacillus sp. V4I9]